MFKEFFNRHISVFNAEEILLDALADTIENGMRLDLIESHTYSDEDKIKVGKRNFKFANSLTDDMYRLLGELLLQREKAYSNLQGLDLFEYYLSLFSSAVNYVKKPYDLQSNGSRQFVNNRFQYVTEVAAITNLKDEYNYLDYTETIEVIDYFVNIDLTDKENNTVLKNLSNLALLKMVRLGIQYFLKDKYVMLNLQYDNISDDLTTSNNLTYIVSANTTQQISIGYFKSDGRKLSKIEYFPYTYYVGNDVNTNEVYLSSTNDRVYLGFITDYLLKSIIIDGTSTFPQLVDFLNFQRHSLKKLTFSDDASDNFSYLGSLNLYQLEEFINKSADIVINNIPSVKMKYIDISESGTNALTAAVFIQWFINRNVYNTVLKVNGSQLGTLDFETLITKLNWKVSYTGTLLGAFTIGEVRILPANSETSWLVCTGYYTNVYDHALLWYVIRDDYKMEKIVGQNDATFYVPEIDFSYIYRGTQSDYDSILELNFENRPVNNFYFPTFTSQFTFLEKLQVYGNFNTVLINERRLTTLHIVGAGNKFELEASTYLLEDINFDEIVISDNLVNTTVTGKNYVNALNTTQLTDGLFINRPISYLFFALFSYIEDLSLFKLSKADLDDTIIPITPALPTGTNYTHFTKFELEDVNAVEPDLQERIFDYVSIDNLVLNNYFNEVVDTSFNGTSTTTVDLKTIDMRNSTILSLYLMNNANLSSIALYNNNIYGELITDSALGYLTTLILDGNTITGSLQMEQLPNIFNIVLNNNSFADIDLSGHNLQLINLTSNTVNGNTINVSTQAPSNYQYVHCDNDNTTLSVNISFNCTEANMRNKLIERFIAEKTSLDDTTLIDFNWSELVEFNIKDNTGFNTLDLSFAFNLEILNINGTQLTDIVIDNNPSLTFIDISNTTITTLDIVSNPNILEIYANNTQFDASDIEVILNNLLNAGLTGGTYESNIFSGTLSANANSYVNLLQTNFGWTINLY